MRDDKIIIDFQITKVSLLPDGTHGVGGKVTWGPPISVTEDGIYPLGNEYVMGVDIASSDGDKTVVSVMRKVGESLEVVDVRDLTKAWNPADFPLRQELLNKIANYYINLPNPETI